MSKVGSILEGLHDNRVNESDDMDSAISELNDIILKKYPKLEKCSFRIYSGMNENDEIEMFLGGRTNIIGCDGKDSISYKKLMKEKDPVSVCIELLKKSVDKSISGVGTNSYADKKLPLIKKFYDAIGEKLDVGDKEPAKKKVRLSDEKAFKKYIGTVYKIVDDYGPGFIIDYPKGARSLRTDLKKKLVEMGYSVDVYKGNLDIEISKKGTLLSVKVFDDEEYDNGVALEASIVW